MAEWAALLGFDLGASTPDANTIRLFREKLTEAGARDRLFADFDRQLKQRGYLAVGGQIVDATLVAAPKQRDNDTVKRCIAEQQGFPRKARPDGVSCRRPPPPRLRKSVRIARRPG